jgi:hypothetical protein
MIDNMKLKSYVLLMSYNIDSIIEKSAANIRVNCKDPEVLRQLDILFNYHKEASKIGNNIDDLFPDMELINLVNQLLRLKFKIPIIVPNVIIFDLINIGILRLDENSYNVIRDLGGFSKRISFLLNKYFYMRDFFMIIYDNYKDLKEANADIEFGTKSFNEILLKKYNKGGRRISSQMIMKHFESQFKDLQRTLLPKYQYIFNHLPFKFLEEKKLSNEQKIKKFFRVELTREIVHYLNSTNIPISKKELFLGHWFSILQLSYDESEFIIRMKAKDKYYKYDPENKDYSKFLRTEGHNALKSL